MFLSFKWNWMNTLSVLNRFKNVYGIFASFEWNWMNTLPVFNSFGRVNCFRVQNFLENSYEPLLLPKTYFKQEITLSIGLPA